MSQPVGIHTARALVRSRVSPTRAVALLVRELDLTEEQAIEALRAAAASGAGELIDARSCGSASRSDRAMNAR